MLTYKEATKKLYGRPFSLWEYSSSRDKRERSRMFLSIGWAGIILCVDSKMTWTLKSPSKMSGLPVTFQCGRDAEDYLELIGYKKVHEWEEIKKEKWYR